jgi:hypothetical protein
VVALVFDGPGADVSFGPPGMVGIGVLLEGSMTYASMVTIQRSYSTSRRESVFFSRSVRSGLQCWSVSRSRLMEFEFSWSSSGRS